MRVLAVAERWFEMRPLDGRVTLLWEPHLHPIWQANIFHVRGRERDLLVDTGMGLGVLRDALQPLIDKPLIAVATHRHVDHAGGLHEFDERLAHGHDAAAIERPEPISLAVRDHAWMAGDPAHWLISAAPHEGFDPQAFRQPPATLSGLIGEGDTVDLGDHAYEVLHLPGHTPGSIGLWDARSGVLFAGDALYEGEIFDMLPESNIQDYVRTMRRLTGLPLTALHGGHGPSVDGRRARELAAAYVARRGG